MMVQWEAGHKAVTHSVQTHVHVYVHEHAGICAGSMGGREGSYVQTLQPQTLFSFFTSTENVRKMIFRCQSSNIWGFAVPRFWKNLMLHIQGLMKIVKWWQKHQFIAETHVRQSQGLILTVIQVRRWKLADSPPYSATFKSIFFWFFCLLWPACSQIHKAELH